VKLLKFRTCPHMGPIARSFIVVCSHNNSNWMYKHDTQ